MTNQERTEQYVSYFREQLFSIDRLQTRLHKKILLVIILDSLSRARYPSIQGVKERFVKMVTEEARWEHADRVSLYRVLLSLKAQEGNALRERAITSLRTWQEWTMPGLEVDPILTNIARFASNEEEKKLLRESTHSNLLYVYRNHLIHEFREPGHGKEMDQGEESPYYHSLTNLTAGRTNKQTWELVYPLGFFTRVVFSSLESLHEYLLKNDLDPYSFFEFGTIWKHKV